MADLKPCPFCGGNARISADTEATRDSQGRLWAFTAVCDICCASSGLTFKPEIAIEAWNRRVNDEK
jgi:Lar family restriction alleviation protein